MPKRTFSASEIESELLFDRDVSGETATAQQQREIFERLGKSAGKLALAFGRLGDAAEKKTAEFREEAARLKLDAELDELETLDNA